jgi:hypothetical protein
MIICKQPYCGYLFPRGMQIGGKCPSCGKSPWATKDEKGDPLTYEKKELEGRKKILLTH